MESVKLLFLEFKINRAVVQLVVFTAGGREVACSSHVSPTEQKEAVASFFFGKQCYEEFVPVFRVVKHA